MLQDSQTGLQMVAEWGSTTANDFDQVRGMCASMTNQGWLVRFVIPEPMLLAPGKFVYRILGERVRPLNEQELEQQRQATQPQAN